MVVANEDSYTFSQLGWVFLSALLWPLVVLAAAWGVLDGVFGPPVRRWMWRRRNGQAT